MRRQLWGNVAAWLLAAFFFVGAFGNTFVSTQIADDYARWGLPENFHYLTACLECTTSVMLILKPLRLYGSLLGGAVMLAAAGTVASHGEYAHAVLPLVVLGVCVFVAVLTGRSKRSLQQ